METEKIRVRFAPSPTGLLHVGNARTALFNWLYARQQGGIFILRIEDTDRERSAEEYEGKLIEDLRWLGLDWDEGPDVVGEFGPYRQSQCLQIYASHTQRLLEEDKAFHCFCSPEELEQERKKALEAGTTPVYSGKCRSLPRDKTKARLVAGEEASIRLKTPGQGDLSFTDLVRGTVVFDLALVGDPVLVRSNGLPAYNYVVVIDDHRMQISHVIRGEDHLANTVRQILTFQALGYPLPQYAHLSMVMGEDNTRLSKRHGATAVDQFGKDGILPQSLFNYLALLGWSPPDGQEVLDPAELVKLFDLSRVSRSAAIFDYGKLHWLNRQHMKALPAQEMAEKAAPFLQSSGYLPEEMSQAQWDWLEQAVSTLIERVDTFADLKETFALLFEFSLDELDHDEKDSLRTECATMVLGAFAQKLEDIGSLNYETFAALTQEIKTETGCKGRELYHPLRLALTGRSSGLDLDKLIPLVESGAQLDFPRSLKTCAQRVAETQAYLS
ncbi:MAG: glutamate--tRNA ligase [Candidatus Aminicenantes bacterium]|nr:glutamate--tRNA ligase [Candidatus Aminicenantes bacterium]